MGIVLCGGTVDRKLLVVPFSYINLLVVTSSLAKGLCCLVIPVRLQIKNVGIPRIVLIVGLPCFSLRSLRGP